jgi:FHS family Na+ dependent glucose MFS transporter 1
MNALHFFFGVGAFISPLVVGQAILRSGGITWAYWLLALLILPSALWVLRLPSPAKETAAKDDPAGQTNYLLVGLIVLFFFFYTGIEAGMGGWTFTYATSLGMPEEMAAYLNSAFWGALTLGRLLSIPLAARFRPRSILLSDLAGCLVSLAIILLWPGSPLAIWIGVLGVGLSIASVFPTTLSLAERRMVITGQMTGWFFVGASAGAMFLPWLIGQLFEAGGPQVVMWVILVDTTLATSIFFVLIARSARMIIKTDQV